MSHKYRTPEEWKEYKHLKNLRHEAHMAFDQLWLSGRVTRKQAYLLIEEWFQLRPEDAHIAKLSAKQCETLIKRINEERFKLGHLREKYQKRRRLERCTIFPDAA